MDGWIWDEEKKEERRILDENANNFFGKIRSWMNELMVNWFLNGCRRKNWWILKSKKTKL